MVDDLKKAIQNQLTQFERSLLGMESKQKAFDSEIGNSIDIKISNIQRQFAKQLNDRMDAIDQDFRDQLHRKSEHFDSQHKLTYDAL